MANAPLGSPDVFSSFDRSSREGTGSGGGAGGGRRSTGGKTPRSRGARIRRVLIVLFVILALLVGGAFFAFERVQSRLDGNIERFGDPFKALPEAERPAEAPSDALNILLLGSDSRVSAGDPTQWSAGAQRTDAIMILHVPADRSGASIVSIPRDSWVDVPGYGKNKINAAFSFGGPTLMIKTIEKLTDVRIDHVVISDFTGFKNITDELGGVTITVAKATSDERATFKAGPQKMDGETALTYVRQRHNLPGGDFDRVKRQQNWIRAVLTQTVSSGTLSNPLKVNAILEDLTKSLSTDDNFTIGEMRNLGVSMRSVRSSDISFLTAPVAGTGRSPDGKQAIVLLDTKDDAPLWKALSGDTMGAYINANRSDLLGETVR